MDPVSTRKIPSFIPTIKLIRHIDPEGSGVCLMDSPLARSLHITKTFSVSEPEVLQLQNLKPPKVTVKYRWLSRYSALRAVSDA